MAGKTGSTSTTTKQPSKSPQQKGHEYMTKRAEEGYRNKDVYWGRNQPEYEKAGPRGRQLQQRYENAANEAGYIKKKLDVGSKSKIR